jgi:predicted dehydrogenase
MSGSTPGHPEGSATRVLIVGTGSIGERHARCFLATRRVTVAIVEPAAAVRDAVAGRYPVAASFATLAEGLAWRPDATVICTPAHLHIPMAREAVAAGSHVLVEKPLSTSRAGVADLAAESAAARRLVGVAYVYRAHPAVAAARELIRSGRFGPPVEVVAVAGQNFPLHRPAYRDTYYRQRATGGGAIQDALTHVVNAVEWIAGPATRLVADCAHAVLDGVEVEDTVHVLARHAGPDGEVLASYALNQHQPANENAITVLCRRGAVRMELHSARCRWSAEPSVQPGGEWHDEPLPPLERDDLFTRQAGAFLDALDGRADLLCPLADGARTLDTMLAVLRSADHSGRAGGWERPTEM